MPINLIFIMVMIMMMMMKKLMIVMVMVMVMVMAMVMMTEQTKYSKTCQYLTPGDKALSQLLFTISQMFQFTISGPIGDGTE